MDVRSVSATAITTATASAAKNGSLKDLLAVLTCYAAIRKKYLFRPANIKLAVAVATLFFKIQLCSIHLI